MIISLLILAAASAGFITGYCFGKSRRTTSCSPSLGRQTFIRKA